jgi:hypothetical protein
MAAQKRRRRPLTPRQEAHQEPRALLVKGRRQAKAALEAIKPQVRSLAASSVNLATQVYGKKAFKLLEALADEDIAPEELLSDVTALAIGHWLKPLESLALSLGKKLPPPATKDVHFNIDQNSQAADPVAIEVTKQIHQYAKKGQLIAQDISGPNQTIPAAHVRYTVSGATTYVSLVGLDRLNLQPAIFQGPINVQLPPGTGYGAGQVVTIGTAHMSIG